MIDNCKYPEGCVKVLDHGFVQLVDSMGNDKSIVNAARVSYQKGTKKISNDETLIRYLVRNQHGTPLEMCEVVYCMRLPLFVRSQLVRHRISSINEQSSRYSEMEQIYYVPAEKDVTFQSSTNKQGGTNEQLTLLNIPNADDFIASGYEKELSADWKWADIFKTVNSIAGTKYESLLKTGMRRELARITLPQSLYTSWYFKINLRSLFNLLSLRLNKHAQMETRLYAQAMYKLAKPIAPIAFSAFEDYILNSITLTSKDLEALRGVINEKITCKDWDILIDQKSKKTFSNKRELSEFVEKMNKLK